MDSSWFAGFAISGDYLYVAYNQAFEVWDITNPESITVLKTIDDPLISVSGVDRIVFEGNFAFVHGTTELYAFNITDPGSMYLINSYDIEDYSHSIDTLDHEATMVVLSADHLIRPKGEFLKSLNAAVEVAQQGRLVTFGIKPIRPATEYGYIETRGRPQRSSGFDV